MVNRVQKSDHAVVHTPLLHHPWFADEREGVTLHRYFDDQFVQRFVQEAASGRLTATHDQEWYNNERFGRTNHDYPTLRLPMHQTFYTVCCEVSCDLYSGSGIGGKPAYDPKRIDSAGFVIRRRSASGTEQRWMLNEGQPLGWRDGAIPEQEPDDHRRFINHKLVQPQYPEPGYSGEEFYPLHPLLVRSREPAADGKERTRSHTLLWGYLPLGGSYRVTTGHQQPGSETTNALRQELSWPFGSRDAHGWQKQDSRPAFKGHANQALYELLELLLIRYRVFDATHPDNNELRSQLSQIHFYEPLAAHPPLPFDAHAIPAADRRKESLLSWIESSRDALLEWLSNIAIGKISLTTALPDQIGLNSDGAPVSQPRNDDLYITTEQAHRLRDTLLLRGGRAMLAMENGLAMPRFGQGDDDTFYVLPFVRWHDECGCEKILWGKQGSIRFRVVSPLDPEAQRPRAVILPGLDDIKRGAAKGVTLMVPKSVADLLRKIRPNMDMDKDGPGNPSGLCWNFSLSIPVITICAFVLLMVIMNLLNIIFRWLPWAFLALPRLCGKLLSENK